MASSDYNSIDQVKLVSSSLPIIECLECGHKDYVNQFYHESLEPIPICPKCKSYELQTQE